MDPFRGNSLSQLPFVRTMAERAGFVYGCNNAMAAQLVLASLFKTEGTPSNELLIDGLIGRGLRARTTDDRQTLRAAIGNPAIPDQEQWHEFARQVFHALPEPFPQQLISHPHFRAVQACFRFTGPTATAADAHHPSGLFPTTTASASAMAAGGGGGGVFAPVLHTLFTIHLPNWVDYWPHAADRDLAHAVATVHTKFHGHIDGCFMQDLFHYLDENKD